MDAAFYDAVRTSLFGGTLSQPQVDGITAICEAWERYGDGDRRKLAYLLATAKHETANTMQPIMERGAKSYFNKYEPGTKIGKTLGNTLKGDGYKFRGAGYVQLTGRANFAKASKKLGLDMVKEPSLALRPDIAARVLITGCMEGWFTGKKLGDYIGTSADYVSARRVINGTDRAGLISGYALTFHLAFLAAPKPATPIPPSTPAAPKQSLWAAFSAWLKAIFKR